MITNLALAEIEVDAVGSTQVLIEIDPAALRAPVRLDRALRSHFRAGEVSQATALAAMTGQTAMAFKMYPRLGVMLGTVDKQGLESLKRQGDAEGVTALHSAMVLSPIRPQGAVAAAAPTSKYTWGLRALKAERLWKQGLTGKGVRVAHLDTGVDARHAALKGAVAAFAEFDVMGNLTQPTPAPWDSDTHGTHTAATIAGRAVSGKHFGVAPGAELYSALVIEGGNVLARVLGGLEWALDQNVKVLSLSLGFRGYNPYFLRIIDVLRANGVLPVVAIGNEGPGTSRSPGNYPTVLSVGAVDNKKRVADFSSSQSFTQGGFRQTPQLLAPGVDILSAKPVKGYQVMSGTSMATPHLAGLAALLFEAKPQASVTEVEQAILAACGPVHPGDAGRAARGMPDATAALKALG